jgi:signal recognition particle subunit SRP54
MFDNLTQKFMSIFDKLGFKGRLTEKNIEDACQEVRAALLEADVNFQVARDFVEDVRKAAIGQEIIKGVNAAQQFVKIVHDRLVALLGEGADDKIHYRAKPPTVIVMAGLQGSGKTTTAAKIAKLARDRDGKRPLLVACDIYRPAAVDQLKILGGQLNIPVYFRSGADPVKLAKEGVEEARRSGEDPVIIDTAGRLHIDEEMMQEVENISKAVLPQEIFLVVDAMTGQDAANSAREFNQRLEISGVILTKLDSDARGGAALSIRSVTGKPIRFAGTSENLDGLEPFHGARMAGRILGMGDVVGLVEKAQQVIDQREAVAMQQKLIENTFTLDDLMKNLRQVKRMGSIAEVLGMIPGLGGRFAGMNIPEGEFKRIEAMISSMTLEERQHPEIIDNSRRFRIARGCGASVAEVSALIKQYYEMKKLFGNKGGLGAAMQGLTQMMQGRTQAPAGGISADRLRQIREERERKREERRRKQKLQKKQRRR